MKAKELMVGDFVHLYINNNGITNEDVKIHSVGEDWIGFCDKFDCDNELSEDDDIEGVSAIIPIPLTEEIMLKNGFHNHSDKYYLGCSERSGIEIRFYNNVVIDIECNYTTHTNRVHLIANYVHEFQHALRLCGLNDIADNIKICK